MRAAIIALIEVVTILFAAFGGFLSTVAPPPGANNELSAVGLASLIALLILSFIKLLFRSMHIDSINSLKPYLWITGITSTLFILVSLNYFSHISTDSFQYPEYDENSKTYLVGKKYTESAVQIIEKNPSLDASPVELVMIFGGINERYNIWPGKSISENRILLTWKYISMVILFCIAIGFAIEGFSINIKRSGRV